MLPKWHLLYGYIFSIILIYFFNFSLLAGSIVFLSSVFIDLDHVLLYFLKTKNLNPYKFYTWSIKRKKAWSCVALNRKSEFVKPHFILHGIEFFVLVLLLSFAHPLFLWIFLGISFHLVLDFIVLFYEKEHLSIKTSQIWLWQRNKNKKEFIVA